MILDRVPLWIDCEAGRDPLCTYSYERLGLPSDGALYAQ
jgi:hypothetical protein